MSLIAGTINCTACGHKPDSSLEHGDPELSKVKYFVSDGKKLVVHEEALCGICVGMVNHAIHHRITETKKTFMGATT